MEKERENSLNWKEIGQRFRDLRLGGGYTQAQICELSSQHIGAITQYERGNAPASINYALFLRNQFGESFDWLYDGVKINRSYEDVQKKRVFDPKSIGKRLEAIRLSEGLNKEEFGKVIGWKGNCSI